MIATAGWDRAIKLYDLRTNKIVGSIGGPLIVGDSLDIFDDFIVTGSIRNKEVM